MVGAPISRTEIGKASWAWESETAVGLVQPDVMDHRMGRIDPMARPRVLVVDDDAVTRFVIREALSAEVDVLEAKDGREGLRAFFSGRPDLVLLDIVMPEMNGREVLSRIRELADVPVIMLTVRDDSSEVVRHLEEGADEYLTKPFRPQELA